jgi:hypothetical protein
MQAQWLSEQFHAGDTYAAHVASGTEEQQRRWRQAYEAAKISPAQKALVETFTRDMKLVIVSGVWCGDCIQQIPLIQRIAEPNAQKIQLRILERDKAPQLRDAVRVNAGNRVPIVLFLAEDFELCSVFGERTLARYRAIARRQLGAACATGIVPPDQDEMAATLLEWLNEIERMQLLLRLSPRLRQKHGD